MNNLKRVLHELDPYRFDVKNIDVDGTIKIDKDLNKYWQYIQLNLTKNTSLKKIRKISNFVYSMKYFYQLKQLNLFNYDYFNNISKILIASSMQYMYRTYYRLLFFDDSLSYFKINLYYICCELKKKINQYKKLGKLAWEEIQSLSREELLNIINVQFYKINITFEKEDFFKKDNISIVISCNFFIDNKLYLIELLKYVLNNRYRFFNNYFFNNLLSLYNVLANNNIFDKKFTMLLYNYIFNEIKLYSFNNMKSILRQYIQCIESGTTLYNLLINHFNSMKLMEKI